MTDFVSGTRESQGYAEGGDSGDGAAGSPRTIRIDARANHSIALPAGIDIDDIKVVGSNLVITLPDGREIIIVDGVIYPPQFVVDGAAIPPQNVVALLLEHDVQPAAGPNRSSGGNFADAVHDIQAAYGLGNLLPYTELNFAQVENREVIPVPVRTQVPPDISIFTVNNPAGSDDASASVSEAGLPARGSEPAGSNAAADSEITTGTMVFSAPDGFASLTIGGVAVTGAGQTITSPRGTLLITAVDFLQGTLSFRYTLADNLTTGGVADQFTVIVTDVDGDQATSRLTINVIDDAPTARPDTDLVPAGSYAVQTGNVITAAGTTSGAPGADTVGADGAAVSRIASVNQAANIDTSFDAAGNLQVNGQYGVLTIKADGSYSYLRNPGTPGGVADQFSYTLTDGDGSTSASTLTINIADALPVVTEVPTSGAATIVHEDGLPARTGEAPGTDAPAPTETTSGTIRFTGGDGPLTATINNVTVTVGAQVAIPGVGTLVVTSYDPAAGVITYDFTLADNTSGDNTSVTFTVVVTDVDGDSAPGTFTIHIVDDVPLAVDDHAKQGAENAPVTINVFANDIPGADSVALNQVKMVPGSLTGGGTLVYNNDGTFTYAPAPGEEGTVSFQYTITDGDGDTSQAKVLIDLLPDSTPTISALGDNSVREDALGARAGETAGSNAASPDEIALGSIAISTGNDSIAKLVINGQDVTNGGVINITGGALTVTNTAGVYTYSFELLDNTLTDPDSRTFTLVVTDSDGDTATTSLVIAIVDDVPTAANDSATVAAGLYGPVMGNVLANDVQGADGAQVVGYAGATSGAAGQSINGTYGVLTIDAGGGYTYTRNAGTPGGVNDNFTYTIQDGDGDQSSAILTIAIADSPTTLTLPPAGLPGTTVVLEAGLPSGSNAAGNGEFASGNFTYTAPDGPATITIDGVAVTAVNQTFVGSFGTLTITAIEAGKISYSYELTTRTAGDTTSDSFAVVVTDTDGDANAPVSLVINIVDDAPTANDDVDTLANGGTVATGNVITGASTVGGTAGPGVDVKGADGAVVSAVTSSNVPASVSSVVAGNLVIAGQYGSLNIAPDGTYTYTRSGSAPLNATETFTYTLKDGDNDTDPATLTINLSDAGVTTTVPTAAANTTVYEAALPARGSEPEGSGEAAAAGANGDPREAVSGVITYTAPDGTGSITIGGTAINLAGTFPQTVVSNATGTLVVTAVDTTAHTIAYTYTLIDNTLTDPSSQSFAVVVTDTDGDANAPVSLVINIVDDAPTANDDLDTLANGGTVATGNVITGASTVGGTAGPGVDVKGADGAVVSAVTSSNVPASVSSVVAGNLVIAGQYGSLNIAPDGTYTYTRSGSAPLNATETFTYTLKDGDNDTDPATLTINLSDAGVTTTVPTAAANTTVYEAALPARGSEPEGSGEAAAAGANGDPREAVSGVITYTAPDGTGSITIGGTAINLAGTFPQTVVSNATGTLVVTAVDTTAHTIAYTYTLIDNTLTDPSSQSFAVVVTDTDGDANAPVSLVINIVDDAPTANDDVDTLANGGTVATGNVITGASTVGGTAGPGVDVKGADGAVVSAVTSSNVPASVSSVVAGNLVIAGQYGSLNIAPDGTYTYTRSGSAPLNATETFTYTLKDGDNDTDPATLTINLSDAGVTTTVPTAAANTTVYEAALPARGSEPEGSGEAAAAGANGDPREAVSGVITYTAPDGTGSITIGGTAINLAGTFPQTVVSNATGTLVVTAVDTTAHTIAYTYTLIDNTLTDPSSQSFAVVVTDTDGDANAPVSLVINIVDDAPTARADTDSIAAGSYALESGNVISGLDTTSGPAGADTVGADGARLSFGGVIVNGTLLAGSGQGIAPGGTVVLHGQYGDLTLHGNGDYTYARTPGGAGGVEDKFVYVLLDGDGDTSPTTLTISIGDSTPSVITPAAGGLTTTVYEAALPARGSEPEGSGEAAAAGANGDPREAVSGTVNFHSGDGIQSLTIGGVALDPALIAAPGGQTIVDDATGKLVITAGSFDDVTGDGSFAYTYTLKDNTSGDTTNVSFAVVLVDEDGDVSPPSSLVINIVDDAPTANDDVDTLANGGTVATGNVITGASTVGGTAGPGVDVKGADGAVVSAVTSSNVPASVSAVVAGNLVIAGQYGSLNIAPDGTYTYTRSGSAPLNATETFTYTLKDGDNDTDPATLTINLSDAGVTTTVPTAAANTTVYEAALPARGSEPEGSGEAAAAGANGDPREAVSGVITYTAPDGTGSITIGGTAINLAGTFPQTVVSNATGTLVVTAVDTTAHTIAYTYTLIDNTLTDPSSQSFAVVVTDTDGDANAPVSLVINIVDDAPTANDDVDTLANGGTVATGNVITGASTVGGTAGPGVDVKGADGAVVSAVTSSNVPASVSAVVAGNLVIAGQYGSLNIAPDGTYTYTRSGSAPLNATETFTYTLKDGDNDTDPATLTINLSDAGVTTTVPTAAANTTVYEAALPARGSEPEGSGEAAAAGANGDPREAVSGVITYTAPDGTGSITIGGTAINLAGTFPQTVVSNATGTLVVTAVDTTAHTIAYTYTLIDNTLTDPSSQSFAVVVTDTDGDANAPVSLVINIVDDAPTANDDVDTLANGGTVATGNVITGASTVGGTAGPGVDVKGADGAVVSAVTSSNVPASVSSVVAGNLVIAGQYGSLNIAPDGTYTYTRSGSAPLNATETFTYTLKDGDNDTDPATLTINLSDAGVTTTVPTAAANTTVYEAALPARGSEPEGSGEAAAAGANGDPREAVSGVITYTAPDGTGSITIGGTAINLAGTFPQTVVSNATGTLVVTAVDTTAHTIAYTYTLIDNTLTDPSSQSFAVVVTDTDGDANAPVSLVINIVDDAPTANDDLDTLANGGTVATGNVITGASTVGGTAGPGVDVKGADGAVVSAVTSSNVPASVSAVVAGNLVIAGQYGSLNIAPDGTYTYTRSGSAPLNATETFTYTLKDGDNDTDPATLTINLSDAGVTTTVPTAAANTTVYEAALPARGSEPEGSGEAAAAGANGDPREAVSGVITYTAPDGTGSITIGGTAINLAGTFPQTVVSNATGTLVVTAVDTTAHTIAYTYTLIDNTLTDPSSQSFAVVVTDTDGDANAPVSLVINIVDDAPTANDDVDTLANGGTVATGNVITGASTVGGTAGPGVDVKGADGAVVSAVTSSNVPASVSAVVAGNLVIAGQYGSLNIAPDGTYTYTRSGSAPLNATETFTYTLKDGDNDTDPATLTINLSDAGVTTTVPTAAANTTVYEAALPARGSEPEGSGEAAAAGANGDPREAVSGVITYTAPDGLGSITIAGTVVNLGSGFPQTVSDNVTGTLVITGVDTTTREIGYTYTLKDNTLVDPDSRSFSVLVTDSDGDSANGTLTVNIIDDVPTLGTVQNQQHSNNPADPSAFGTLHLVTGADGLGTATVNVTNLTDYRSGGYTLVGHMEGTTYVAYQDTNGTGIVDTGDIAAFKIDILPYAGTSGQYQFTLLQPLTTTPVPFNIQNDGAFGSGPSNSIVVTDGATPATKLVYATGWDPTGGFTAAELAAWKAGGNPDLTQNSNVNGSSAGWGNYNNNFDAGEFLRFDFGALNDYDGAGAYTVPAGSGDMAHIQYAQFTFFNAKEAADQIVFVVHYKETNGTGTYTENLTVNGDKNNPPAGVTFTASPGYEIDWVDTYQSSGDIKLNLGNIGIITQTIDKTINATLQVTDGDGDATTTSLFSIHIAAGLTPFAPAAPVALDLDGNGIHYLAQADGVTYAYNGSLLATAWVGPEDGILVRDANANGNVDSASEFVFGHDGVSDLTALYAQYGAVLDAGDPDFGKFMVWQDANSNGVADPGELKSLAALGISSIGLVSDGHVASAAGGDVQILGTSSYVKTDGAVRTVADVMFATGEIAAKQGTEFAQEQDRTANATATTAALVAAAAAAVMPIAAAAAELHDGNLAASPRTDAPVATTASESIVASGSNHAPSALAAEPVQHAGTTIYEQAHFEDAEDHSSSGSLGSGPVDHGAMGLPAAAISVPAPEMPTHVAAGSPMDSLLGLAGITVATAPAGQGAAIVHEVLANGPGDAVVHAMINSVVPAPAEPALAAPDAVHAMLAAVVQGPAIEFHAPMAMPVDDAHAALMAAMV